MVRSLSTAGCLALMALSGSAEAQQPPAPPPQAAPQPMPLGPGVPRAGMVRVHFQSYKSALKASLYAAQGNGQYAFVCVSPCDADIAPGAALRVTLDNDNEHPHDFIMEGTPGSSMTMEARPASKGALAGGIVMVSIGGLTGFIGLVLVAAGSWGHTNDDAELRTAGWVTLLLGGGLTAGGIALMVNRSTEPRIRELPPSAPQAPRAATPLSWTFTF